MDNIGRQDKVELKQLANTPHYSKKQLVRKQHPVKSAIEKATLTDNYHTHRSWHTRHISEQFERDNVISIR